MTEDQKAMLKRLGDRADFARLVSEIADALVALGRPATLDEIQEIVHARYLDLSVLLATLVKEGVLKRDAPGLRYPRNDPRRAQNAKYSFPSASI